MLRHFIQKVHQNRFAHPRVVVCVPSGVTGVEKRAVEEACLSAGARQAYLIEEPMAAAIGAGLPVAEPTGSMVVDIGGGTSEVAVISLGGIVVSQSIRVGGDEMDDAIVNYCKDTPQAADRPADRRGGQARDRLGDRRSREEIKTEIRGRDIVSGLPKTVMLTLRGGPRARSRTRSARSSTRSRRRSTARRPSSPATSWTAASPSPAAARCSRASSERLREECQMPAQLADSPLTCVAVGSGRSLEEFETIHRASRNSNRRRFAASAG